ncbi:MAG: NAD(P)/FAD-dependent oxidoreductase [Burkholderiales bacterium]|nr:NAD(P)/FAD-dependent oxidoreductase [Burkholderiales bacterium]
MSRPRIVILGCGFGGLWAARALARADADITLYDRTNHHLFQPLLYQVATAGLTAPAIAAPIRHILRRQKNLTVLMADATDIDASARAVRLADGSAQPYDYLVVATGAGHSYFGHDDWAPWAPGLKTLDDAMEIRRRILLAFEEAERTDDAAARDALLNFVVIGGGATGVEMAGTMAEIARHTLPGEFRRIDTRQSRVVLLEGGPRVLPAFDAGLSERARQQLVGLGVDVRCNAAVTGIDAAGVRVGTELIRARTVIWAAGVRASPLGAALARTAGATLDRAGRVVVEPDLSLARHPEIFVIGDLAAATSGGKPVPGVSPAAKQMGACAARNIRARIAGRAPTAFRYKDYGSLATIGRNSAVVALGRFRFWGYPAWLFWLFIHIYFLIGFRNRLVVLMDWFWAYWSFERYARVVFGGGIDGAGAEPRAPVSETNPAAPPRPGDTPRAP